MSTINDSSLSDLQRTNDLRNKTRKIFIANPNIGISITDINEDNPIYNNLLNLKWSSGLLQMTDQGNKKYYDVDYIELNNNTYLKPIKPYHCYNFENTFGFQNHCENFKLNKFIKINNFELST